MHTILLVDDEKCVLDSLYRGLKKEPYDIICAESGREALDILVAQDVAVILSDVKMPGMNGIEFLKRASEKSPYSVKMLLSGYSEFDLIVDAVNTANLWRYVPKPWNNDELIMAINNGIQYYELSEERRQLVLALEKKNRELEELNNSLENKVRERTELINCHVNMLMALINGIGYTDFVNLIVPEIKKVLKACDVSIIQIGEDGQYVSCGKTACADAAECSRLIATSIESRVQCHEGNICVVPIENGNEVFAVLVINGCKENIKCNQENLDSLLVIFRIAIQRELMKVRTSSIMGDIEKLLEGC